MFKTTPRKFFVGTSLLLTAGLMFLGASYFGARLAWAYVIAINGAAFTLCGYDKNAARAAALRVPEKVLLGVSLIGGSAGLLIGMKLFRHKTRKASFQFLLALVLVAQLLIVRFV